VSVLSLGGVILAARSAALGWLERLDLFWAKRPTINRTTAFKVSK
jgi:hypothetical protein